MILVIHNSHYYWVGGPSKVSTVCVDCAFAQLSGRVRIGTVAFLG